MAKEWLMHLRSDILLRPGATPESLSVTYGRPEVLCNSLVDMYLGKRTC